jgi:hypothetical protein
MAFIYRGSKYSAGSRPHLSDWGVEVKVCMEILEENANKVMIALLGTEMRPYSGEELSMETGMPPQELNRTVELLQGQAMLSVVDASPRDPYSFGTVRVTAHGQKVFRDLKRETTCRV